MERFFLAKLRIEVWLVCLLAILVLVAFVIFGAIVRNAVLGHDKFGRVGAAAERIAAFPGLAQDVIEKLLTDDLVIGLDPSDEDRFPGKSGWSRLGDIPKAMGDHYILLSRYDGDIPAPVYELVDPLDLSTIHKITIDVTSIFRDVEQSDAWPEFDLKDRGNFISVQPVIFPNGDTIAKSHGSPLARIDPCGERVWVENTYNYHHSTELDSDGSLLVPNYIHPATFDRVPERWRDDGIARLAPDGEIISVRSVADLLVDIGWKHRIFPVRESTLNPIHLNDIQPVTSDGPFWKKGDLFLSIRNLSAIAQYRPSEDRIVWVRQGPWSGQHDVDILDDRRIAVFNNNTYTVPGRPSLEGHNQILVYDFSTNEITNPYGELLSKHDVRTRFEGLYEVIGGNVLMVEETEEGRLLLFSESGELFADFVNRSERGIFPLTWTTVVSRDAGDAMIAAAKQKGCLSPSPPPS